MKSCSDLIAQMLDEREELDPENDEPIQILVSGQQFSGKEVKIAFNYLEHYKYCPPDYGKIISNVIKKNCRDDYDTALIMQYDLNNIKLLHSVASFFQIRSLTRLCYIRIGIEVYMNTNESGAVTKMCEKFAITETYTITTEKLLLCYPIQGSLLNCFVLHLYIHPPHISKALSIPISVSCVYVGSYRQETKIINAIRSNCPSPWNTSS